MFHTNRGLYFDRLEDGSVRVIKREHDDQGRETGEELFAITLDANSWASVIASMSKRGEDSGGFERAKTFHESPI